MNTAFSVGETFRFSLAMFKKHFKLLIEISLAMLGISLFGSFIQSTVTNQFFAGDQEKSAVINLLFVLVFTFIQLAVSLGWIHICLKVVDGQPTRLSDLTTKISFTFRYWGAAILLALVSVAPAAVMFSVMLAFSITTVIPFPGLGQDPASSTNLFVMIAMYLGFIASMVWAIGCFLRCSFFSQVMIDKNLGAIASLKESAKLTKHRTGYIIRFDIVSGFLFAIANIMPAIFVSKIFQVDYSMMTVESNFPLMASFRLVNVFLMPLFSLGCTYLYRQFTIQSTPSTVSL